MPEILMPQLSESMTEGKLLRWCIAQGDRVSPGDIIAEVETDKANMEVEATAHGVMAHLLANPGDTITVGTAIARIDPHPVITADDIFAGIPADVKSTPASARDDDDLNASPLAIRIAEEHGIDLRDVTGTGIDGRIMKEDVLTWITAKGQRSDADNTSSPPQSFAPGLSSTPRNLSQKERSSNESSFRVTITDNGLIESVPILCERSFSGTLPSQLMSGLLTMAAIRAVENSSLPGFGSFAIGKVQDGDFVFSGPISKSASLEQTLGSVSDADRPESRADLVILDLTDTFLDDCQFALPGPKATLCVTKRSHGKNFMFSARLTFSGQTPPPGQIFRFLEEFAAFLKYPILFLAR